MLRNLLLVAALVAMPACSKDDAPAPAPAPTPSESAATAVLPPSLGGGSASALAAASAAPATGSSAASEAASAAPSASAVAAATSATPASSAKGAPTCGDKPLPPCPLYAWMKKNTSAAMSAQDFDALATALDKVATFAPKAGYPNWASISRDGAAAAHVQNLDAVKASCRGCHNQYKDKYKKEMRDRPI